MPSDTSTRGLARRFNRFANRDKGDIAWVGHPDGVTVNVPGTTNQIYIKIKNDVNQTHPAFNLTGTVFVVGDMVWCELRRGEWWVIGEYTLTP